MSHADPPSNPKAQAKADKAYAKANRPWYKKKRFIIPLAFVALMIIVSATSGTDTAGELDDVADVPSASDSDKGSDSGGNDSAAKPETNEPDVSTNAAAMVKEFQDNELAADKKYKGKWIEVTGVVDKLDTEVWNDEKYVLNIGGGTDFEILTVNCYDIPNDDLADVSKGDDVTVVGKFKDGGDLGVELKKCRLT